MPDNKFTIYTKTCNPQEVADLPNGTWINTSRYSHQELLTTKRWGHVAWTLLMLNVIFEIIAADQIQWWYWVAMAAAVAFIALEAVGWWRTYQERRANK